MEMEFQGLRDYIEKYHHDPQKMQNTFGPLDYHKPNLDAFLYVYFLKGTVLHHLDDFTKIYLPYLDKSYSEIHDADFDTQIRNSDPFLKMAFQGHVSSLPRIFATESQNRITELTVALEYYRMKNKEYPDSLEQLSPGIIKEPILDPITGKPFMYHKTDEAFELYSIGPDLKDDKGELVYDPTNGTVSAGDIVY